MVWAGYVLVLGCAGHVLGRTFAVLLMDCARHGLGWDEHTLGLA
jgi:hypothetical protein